MCKGCWEDSVAYYGTAQIEETLEQAETLQLAKLVSAVFAWKDNPHFHGGPAHAQLDDCNTDMSVGHELATPNFHPAFSIEEQAKRAAYWANSVILWYQPDSPWPAFVEAWDATDELNRDAALAIHHGWSEIGDVDVTLAVDMPDPEPFSCGAVRCQPPIEIELTLCEPDLLGPD